MIIKKLDPNEYAGKPFTVVYHTNGYWHIERTELGFQITYRAFGQTVEKSFTDHYFGDWLEEPRAYGAFEGETLLGFVEGAPEHWNNRYRISNICLFEEENRHHGLGSQLIEIMLHDAAQSGARMAVLETQTCNEHAIAFYRKHGFEIIGFDLFSYSNDDPQRREVRIEMGKPLT